MAPSQISILRVTLFILTISGALFGAQTSPVDSSISTPLPFSDVKGWIEEYIKAFRKSFTIIDNVVKLEEIKTAIEGLKVDVGAKSPNAAVIQAAKEKIRKAIAAVFMGTTGLNVTEFKEAEDTLMKETELVIGTVKADPPTTVYSAAVQNSADLLIKKIQNVIGPFSLRISDQFGLIRMDVGNLNDILDNVTSADFKAIKDAIRIMKEDIDSGNVTAEDKTNEIDVAKAIKKIDTDLSKIEEETNKLTDSRATAPKATEEAEFFSGFTLVLVIVVGVIALVGIIIGGVVYCMKKKN